MIFPCLHPQSQTELVQEEAQQCEEVEKEEERERDVGEEDEEDDLLEVILCGLRDQKDQKFAARGRS